MDKRHLRITELFYEIYCDTKIGTCSANSLPSRRLARLAAKHAYNTPSHLPLEPFKPSEDTCQYNNPSTIQRMRHKIANQIQEKLRKDLEECWSAFYLQDASVDLKQHDNEFHGVSYVDFKTGKLCNRFLGVVKKTKRGTVGQIDAFLECCQRLYPESEKVKQDQILSLMKKARGELNKTFVGEDESNGNNLPLKEVGDKPNFNDVVDFDNFEF